MCVDFSLKEVIYLDYCMYVFRDDETHLVCKGRKLFNDKDNCTVIETFKTLKE